MIQMSELDHEELGLRVGLEIHQQLDTRKLFCRCPSIMTDKKGEEVRRYLRVTQSELGEVDKAALMEAQKGLRFRYQTPKESSCLVELDEEPPVGPDEDAFVLALKMALLMKANIADELHFMRKIVIDGSNTSGFQRTGLLATDGKITVDGKDIGISTICLEEDAARSVEKKKKEKIYRLDRLGIPLIEIATDPDINTPEEAKEVARYIGGLLRATKQVKRGIGTIREDVNISIARGARVEIKGVQELRMLPDYIVNEVERQLMLLNIMDELHERKAAVDGEIIEITDLFSETSSSIVLRARDEGKRIFSVKLEGFDGVLRGPDGEPKLGPELADYARKAGVAGIFHSDELPKYGITKDEKERISDHLDCGEKDAFAIVVEHEEKAKKALEKVIQRCGLALKGVPEETREAQLDGTTKFSRPLSGEARMYPETDIPPVLIKEEMLKEIELPEKPEVKIKRFVDEYGLNKQQANQLFKKEYDDLFEEAVTAGCTPSIVVNTFLHIFPDLERDGYEIEKLITSKKFKDILLRVEDGDFAKEGIPTVMKGVLRGKSIDKVVEEAGLESVEEDKLREVISDILDKKQDLIEDRQMGAMGPLMGVIMKEFRGKVDGKDVSRVLKEELVKRVD